MALLEPTIHCDKITDISLKLLKTFEVKVILLDVDNTIASYRSKSPVDGSLEWLNTVKNAGYMVYIVSNNFEKRVSAIAKKFDLPYISFALKPLTLGFLRIKNKLKLKSNQCLVVGDQIFTDILGANLAGMKSVLLTPIELEKGFSIEARRHLEKKIRKNAKLYKD